MGVDYRAMIYVGKAFEDSSEAEQFIRDNVGFTEDEEELIKECDLQELVYGENRFNLGGDMINCYSGYGFILGTELSVADPEKFAEQYHEAVSKWNKLFPEHPAKLIKEVKVY